MVIKAQVLANFMAKFTHDVTPELEVIFPEAEILEKRDQEDEFAKWKLFVDG